MHRIINLVRLVVREDQFDEMRLIVPEHILHPIHDQWHRILLAVEIDLVVMTRMTMR
jgi:hypothetical protein